ncbi:hypothetical protein FRY74_06295 [Vicingus serpentipes]|uniref:Uncharacterized protein n=1 Tax=Vicingus serpentipes TaxID=1926625 RepID=A0A5C6RWE2_9FLAO|nr:hypothetical protein [Vicingus serpentipes]TXB66179.1 hypothetical protein FRY74_06295 [Vicingus serpentipes]
MKKLLLIALLFVIKFSYAEEIEYVLENIQVYQYDSLQFEDECDLKLSVSESSVIIESEDHEETFVVLSQPDINGFVKMRLLGKDTRWEMAITPYSSFIENYKENYETYLVEIYSDDSLAINNVIYAYKAFKKNMRYDNFPSLADLKLNVSNYIFVDYYGNPMSESEHKDKGVYGFYNNVIFSQDEKSVSLTFELNEHKKILNETHEKFNYEVFSYMEFKNRESWLLIREDGIQLIFNHFKDADNYSLVIPVKEESEELFVYVFEK